MPVPDLDLLLDAIRSQASRLVSEVRFRAVGTVQHVGDGVATLSGLAGARTEDVVLFPTGVRGLILTLDHDHIDAILLGSDKGIRGGDLVVNTDERLRVPVGRELLGRIVDPLGKPLDSLGPLEDLEEQYLEGEIPDIVIRAPVNEPLQTGLKIVDALIPIGRGQRELILGDRQTGKTSLAVDAILNQRDTDVACVYVAIGQKKSSTLSVIETLRSGGAMPYTCVVASSPDDPPALRYLAPMAGCAIAEQIMREGRDVLVVYDDLSRHAEAYREISLLLRRPPGREAYPGDIFYLHARLLERACKLNAEAGGGSLTALPIVETLRGNIAAYIPTNLISITDGQIVLDTELFNRGVKPAVNTGVSVSRVGGAAQTSAMRAVAARLRLELAQAQEVAQFARLGADVDEATRRQIARGERVQAALVQPAGRPMSLAGQVFTLLAATEGHLDAIPLDDVPSFVGDLLDHIDTEMPEVGAQLNGTGVLADDARTRVSELMQAYSLEWLERRQNDENGDGDRRPR